MEQWQQEAPAGREPALIPVGARVVRRCLLHLAVLIICCTPLPPLVGSSIGMERVCQCAGRPAVPITSGGVNNLLHPPPSFSR